MPKPPITQNSGFLVRPTQTWFPKDRKDLLHRDDGPANVQIWRRAMSMEWYQYSQRLCYVRVIQGNLPIKVGC